MTDTHELEAEELLKHAALSAYGIDVLGVGLWWGVVGGLPSGRVWRVTLRRAYPLRYDERPTFVTASAPHP